MKTKEEVIAFLKENGFTRNARTKIAGFLTGAGIKENEEALLIREGEGRFDDFYEWFCREEEAPSELSRHLSTLFALAVLVDNEDVKNDILDAIEFFASVVPNEEE